VDIGEQVIDGLQIDAGGSRRSVLARARHPLLRQENIGIIPRCIGRPPLDESRQHPEHAGKKGGTVRGSLPARAVVLARVGLHVLRHSHRLVYGLAVVKKG